MTIAETALDRARSSTARSSTSIATRCGCRMDAKSPSMSSVTRDRSSCCRCRIPKAHHPDPAVPVCRQPLPVGAAGGQRGRRGGTGSGGGPRVPRGDRAGAGHGRPARVASTRRPGSATRRCSSSGCRVSRRRQNRPRWTRTRTSSRERSASRDARDMVRRGEIIDMKTVAGLALI